MQENETPTSRKAIRLDLRVQKYLKGPAVSVFLSKKYKQEKFSINIMNKTMPVAVQSCAERFAENWKAQNPTDREDDSSLLDDSLTNLQWLHSISIQDLTPATSMAQSPSPSTNSCDSDDHSETSDGCKQVVIAKEPNIDYKNDPTQKPPYSYATLICMAMRETNKTKITLSAIYKWIKENFMYYRQADPTWQNSIRHNLSLNKCFMKVARNKNEPGKGGFWKIDPAYADMFVDGVFKRRRGVNTQKPSKKSSSKTCKKASNKRSSECLKRENQPQTKKKFKGIKIKVERESDNDDVFFEEEIAPFPGGVKEEFSWMTVLTNDEIDQSIREIADAHGIGFNITVPSSTMDPSELTRSNCLSPPPSTDSIDHDHFESEPDLDLTVRGIGLLPLRENLATPSPTTLTDAAHSVFNMPPSPPLMYEEEHPWAESPGNDFDDCFDLDDNNNGLW